MQCTDDFLPPSGGMLDPSHFRFLQTHFLDVQAALRFSRKSSPYFSTAHARRAFFAAIATTARQ
jgi:hypothetical protein